MKETDLITFAFMNSGEDLFSLTINCDYFTILADLQTNCRLQTLGQQ